MKASHLHRSATFAFTLVELLCVIAIISMLASLLFPVIGSFTNRARSLKCQNNLRQLCMAVHNAANDNDNRFPTIEPDIEKPVHTDEDKARPILEVLQPYGITEAVLQCPDDLRGPKWYDKKKTSYEWRVYVEDEDQNQVTIYTPRFNFPVPQSRVRLFNDWEPVHPDIGADVKLAEDEYTLNRMNTVFADGHVISVRPSKPQGGGGGRGGPGGGGGGGRGMGGGGGGGAAR